MKTMLRLVLLLPLVAACATTQSTRPAALTSTPDQPPPLQAGGRTTSDTFAAAGGRTAPLRILHDYVGVLLRDGAAAERVAAIAAPLDLRVVQQYEGGIVIFRLPAPRERAEIMRLARELRALADRQIALAGLVVLPGEAVVPMIVPDEVVAEFRGGMAAAREADVESRFGVTVVRDPLSESRVILRIDDPARDAITVANALRARPDVAWAHPNFVVVVVYRQVIPNDSLFANQWHHQNGGASSGTVDGDVDTPEAWAITRGAPGTVIAVIDDGFDLAHPDLTPNAWVNGGEIAGNGADDDGNGFVDDVNGYDFAANDGNPSPGGNHGSAVAGVAAARGDNSLGVAGSCLECTLMFLRNGSTVATQAQAFDYARLRGAAVITNSWGYAIGTPTTAAVETAINNAATLGRGGAGAIVLFAMNNGNINDCTGANPDISAIPTVIAVSASSNQERKVTESAFGDCMEILAPTHRGYGGGTPFSGTLNVVTTDRSGVTGYNNTSPVSNCPTAEASAGDGRNYTACFRGTSSATPLTAGIAALAVTVAPALDRLTIQRLLQDTADKMQDSTGAYAATNGFSDPSGGAATHGWGRVNAFEAVRVVAPAGAGGRGGVDVFLRDNRLDWGNTEQPSNVTFEPTRGFIAHWVSVDIKVDAPPHAAAPATNAAFESFVDENPISGQNNRVYVRVRNRGPNAAASTGVKLHWAFAGTALPPLPGDFWTAFPGDSTDPSSKWTSLGTVTLTGLAYSGASAAATAGDAAQIATFTFPGPPIDTTQALPHHFCLLAVLDTAGDRPLPLTRAAIPADFIPDLLTPSDNNVTHRNLFVEDELMEAEGAGFFVRNPTRSAARVRLLVEAPKGVDVRIEGFPVGEWRSLGPGEEVLARVRLQGRANGGTVRVTQESETEQGRFRGGIVIAPRPSREPNQYR